MKTILQLGFVTLLMIGIAACSSSEGTAEVGLSVIKVDGVMYEINDAAIASNCLSLTFSVRGYMPQTDDFPRRGFLPIKDIVVRSSNSEPLRHLLDKPRKNVQHGATELDGILNG